ncbi:MAG: dihydropteroate synthase [Nitrosomonadaceae bacterium]|nr:dihydropteroate synthase [Nitrosomonadaceae bacterium]|tara:strand:+ start:799 stop:1569 length:771 start_codon:yes stop_codon:yes gene_type:complete
MGIVNVTPDSFSDGGLYASTNDAVLQAERLIREGVDILDIGGESTRPGSIPVSSEEELRRVLPVVQALANVDIPISVDTSKPEVMLETIKAGANMINDINALQSPGALEVVADSDVTICLMHMQGRPKYMQSDPQYKDVIAEIKYFLQQRIDVVKAAGIAPDRIVIDPGFGFGKTLEHNLKLLRYLDQFIDLSVPIMAGLSRKSMLKEITGNKKGDLVYPSIAAALMAAVNGARILRVHDVKATKDALKVYNSVTS